MSISVYLNSDLVGPLSGWLNCRLVGFGGFDLWLAILHCGDCTLFGGGCVKGAPM
jgi:hypothetical protein